MGFWGYLFMFIGEFHRDVVYNVLSFRNLFDLRVIPCLFCGFWLAFSLSEMLFTVFICLYLLDYITGIFATIVELRGNLSMVKERRYRKGRLYWIESGKLIRGLVKLLVYFQLILVVSVLSYIFEFEYIRVHSMVIPLTPLQVLLVLCIASEFVSNLENAKRSGFDIVLIVRRFIRFIKRGVL